MEDSLSYQLSPGLKILIVLAYVVSALLPLLLAIPSTLWAAQDIYSKLGNGLLLIAFSLFALQPVLAARVKVLDRAFGLDIVYVLHKTMGMAAGSLWICALVFIIASVHGPSLSWIGMIGTVLIISLVLSALLYRELRLTYEAWRRLHNVLFAGVLIAVSIQALSIAAGMESIAAGSAVITLFIIAAAVYLHHKVIGPAHRRKQLYRVTSVTQETKNVWTVTFSPPEGIPRFAYLPGQFQFITFSEGNGEEHPFTIPSSPAAESHHTATIKESGDFTRTISRIKTGDRIAIQAPYGRFSYALYPDEKDLVLIAGGIGITPFMSMLRHMHDMKADKEVLLLYANNTEEDIVFRQELDAIASAAFPRLRVEHVLSQAAKGWRGERGRIDRAMIEKHVQKDLKGRVFYLCGPPPMMTALIAALIDLGVPSRRIRSERFAL